MIVSPTQSSIATHAQLLLQGELASFPTETVYGLGAIATQDSAIQKIYDAKGRPSDNPLIIHIASIKYLDEIIAWESDLQKSYAQKLFCTFSPGPLSIVLPKKPHISNLASAHLSTIGVRIPAHPVALQLLEAVRLPVAAPSANKSNYISPTTAAHVEQAFPEIPILDGGQCAVGIESTIISISKDGTLSLLRPGFVTKEQIAHCLQISPDTIQHVTSNSKKIAPGMSLKHYSPKTKLQLLSDVDLWNIPPQRIGFIAFREHQHLDFDFHAIETLSPNGDQDQIASRLFAALHDMDALELDLILIDSCLETGVGCAIMDRLRRALHF